MRRDDRQEQAGGPESEAAGARFADSDQLGRSPRLLALTLVAIVHLGLALIVVRGLGVAGMLPEPVRPMLVATDIPLAPPAPAPTPTPSTPATASREDEGREGAAGRKARATQVVAPRARIVATPPPLAAAPVAGSGNDTRSGALAAGEGSGGGAAGTGTGSGGSGSGAGGRRVATRPVKVAGDITSARDYPREGRETRLGRSVVIMLTVGTDGRVAGCRIYRPSGDASADAVTCRLATERFRFRPALDQNGNPIEATFGWEQRWFAP
ncbi:TonB family protein [Novosphingobium huizhouense]|uniref:TonB family protein n=1 Tax=Novosphingobium huizhouense TaxID=2866625 RepID=UPI001CD8F989|nr:TonB family protein [Novosphingobium huizhouense]